MVAPVPAGYHTVTPYLVVADGVSVMEPSGQFYGDRNAGVREPWGSHWWIAAHIEDVDEAEIQRRMTARG